MSLGPAAASLDLTGRAGIVTGGSRGIGLAIARLLHARGAAVCITGRDPASLEQAIAEIGGGDRAMALAGNVRDADHRRATVDAVVERFGSLGLLVNNTGVNPAYGPLVDADLGAVSRVLETNLVAALGWVQEAHRAWMGAHGGTVVNVASVAGLRPAAGVGAYGASKAALLLLTRQLAHELAPAVRVNAVAPALVRTAFAAPVFEGREDVVATRYPLGRIGEPADVAEAVAFLLSDAASWITGATISPDGGSLVAHGV